MTTPQYEFADDSPVRTGRKHRRGRGYTPPIRKGAGAPANRNTTSTTTSRLGSAYNSLRSGGHKVSSKASSAALSSQQSQQKQKSQTTSYSFASSDAWDNANNTALNRSNNSNSNNKDDNSCTGSLTYSASSSIRSEESSNESSFGDILSKIDSDGSSGEVKEFIQSKAASYGNYSATGGGQCEREGLANNDPAVQGYKQRQAAAQRQKHSKQEKKSAAQARGLKKRFGMAAPKQHVPTNSNDELNYSRDDSSESDVDVFGEDLDDDNVLETIGGLDDDHASTRPANASAVTSNIKAPAEDPFRSNGLHQASLTYNNNNTVSSAPSSPRSRSTGHVTPPPNARHKRTSTPPGSAGTPISRTNSRHSKSSSDGSFDTPAPSSPPMSKPPHHHARSAPVTKTNNRRGSKSSSRKKSPNEETAVTDPSAAFYTSSWMCGFTDAFNFEGFDKFQK